MILGVIFYGILEILSLFVLIPYTFYHFTVMWKYRDYPVQWEDTTRPTNYFIIVFYFLHLHLVQEPCQRAAVIARRVAYRLEPTYKKGFLGYDFTWYALYSMLFYELIISLIRYFKYRPCMATYRAFCITFHWWRKKETPRGTYWYCYREFVTGSEIEPTNFRY